MYNKSKNGLLFVVFIFIVILTLTILVLSVHNVRNSETEEYKISLNNTIYDKDYNYVDLIDDATLKKEWDDRYYLYTKNDKDKYDLGTETVLYDRAKTQVNIYGTVYQVFENGDVAKINKKASISNLEGFQFFKLNDRKYLMICNTISSVDFKTSNYLMISIDKAGNALLVNNDVNVKTIHPLTLSCPTVKFDVANEKLIYGDESIDLKKINGSTNEYVQVIEEYSDNKKSENNSNNSNNSSDVNNKISQELVQKIINISGILGNKSDQTMNLYKNIKLKSINPKASYVDVSYLIVDPEDKYLSVFLSIKSDDFSKNYHISKESSTYRISGLKPNTYYELTLNYIDRAASNQLVADSVTFLTSTDPTVIRITKIDGYKITYNVKMYNDYEFESADVAITNCGEIEFSSNELNIDEALSNNGLMGEFVLTDSDLQSVEGYICVKIKNATDFMGNPLNINSYHKIEFN